MVLPGAMAIILVPNLPNADMVFPTLVTTVLPVGVTGLVLAGLIAAIMSSVDSTLNSGSTLVVHDFVLPRRPDTDPRTIGLYGKLTTLILMVLAIAWAPQIANFGGLWAYLQQAFSIIVPSVATTFLVGAFWKRANGDGAFYALVLGHVIGAGLFVLGQVGLWPVHFTINVGIMAAVSAAIMVFFSFRGAAPSDDVVDRTVWRPDMVFEDEPGMAPSRPGGAGGPGFLSGAVATTAKTPWYASIVTWSLLLLAAMGAVLIGFW